MTTKYELGFGEVPVEPKFWFTEAPLYHSEDYKFDAHGSHGWGDFRSNLLAIFFPTITIDVYCHSCERETVFVPTKREVNWVSDKGEETIKNGVCHADFHCSRKECGSGLYFTFLHQGGIVTKIGQFPSIADLIKPTLQKYKQVLSEEQMSDWQRAVGLRAHGVGAGSYVYLRRIIEQLIGTAFAEALEAKTVSNDEYQNSRWPERIKLLANFLPDYLVENSVVYGVLSKGVHELTENACVEYFDVMHTTIEIICEQKLATIERAAESKSGGRSFAKSSSVAYQPGRIIPAFNPCLGFLTMSDRA